MGRTRWSWWRARTGERAHDRRPRQGLGGARAPLPRPDPPHPRYCRAVQGGIGASYQEGPGAARQDDRQPVLRSLHPHPHLLRVRRETSLGGHRERGRVRQRRAEGRDARRHREKPRGDADRHGGDPPSVVRCRPLSRQPHPLQRRQRRRRHARAPHPGTAGSAHDPRPAREDRRAEGLPGGRHPALAGRPLEHLGAAEARRRSRRVWTRHADAARHRRARRLPLPPHRRSDRVGRRAERAPAAAGTHGKGIHPEPAGVLPGVRRHARAARQGAARAHDHAPGTHEPRRGDRLPRRRRGAQRHPRPGDEWRGGAHGRALPAGRWTPRARRRGQGPRRRDRRVTRPLLLTGGRVIDPSRDFDQTTDVLVQDGKVAAIGAGLGSPDGADVRDVRGRVVAPGLVDVHVHLREPGNEDVETIASGTRAAAAGGFTAVCAMPNTDPVTDNQAAVGFIVRQSVRAGLARVYPIGAISVGQKGEQLSEFGEMVGRAKEQGIRVTAEVTPHHLTLTDHTCEGYDTHAKMNPPLREAADVAALRAALKQGVIDCIASDHAPHAYDAKEAAFDDAPFGIVGLETAFAVAYTELVLGGALTLPELIARMSSAPAAAFRLPGGALTPGVPADIVVLDITARWTVDPANFHSKSRNSPFAGRTLTGRPVLTLVGGAVVHEADGTTL